jgi:hypothetical protein
MDPDRPIDRILDRVEWLRKLPAGKNENPTGKNENISKYMTIDYRYRYGTAPC